jgi:quercetin dioxygenase-like cupin family protein
MNLPAKLKIDRLQAEMSKLPQVEQHTEHFFADGMYGRLVFSPAGTVIVGKEHKTEHFYIVLSGLVRVTTPDGIQDVRGPKVFVCPPGTKRAVLVLEDAWRMNVHVNRSNTTDMDALESALIKDDGLALFDSGNKRKLELLT